MSTHYAIECSGENLQARFAFAESRMAALSVRPPPLRFTVCRFEAGRITKRLITSGDVEYITISHAWGNADWRRIRGFDGMVMASESKVRFIERQLPALVGRHYFWIDILCLDQNDHAARVAITQHIPKIFRGASRTIMVKAGDGLRQCCVNAIGETNDYLSLYNVLERHKLEEHPQDRITETVLKRLWILQEAILSDKIQFTTCDETYVNEDLEDKMLYLEAVTQFAVRLKEMAAAWARTCEDATKHGDYEQKFMLAFIHNRTVTRETRRVEGIKYGNGENFRMFRFSAHRASKPRDYILATMPQFEFYIVPANARHMTFPELYMDCFNQYRNFDGEWMFQPLLTGEQHLSMNEIAGHRLPPTQNIPQPDCLGDFVKLFGGPILETMSSFVPDPQLHNPRTSSMHVLRFDRSTTTPESLTSGTLTMNLKSPRRVDVSPIRLGSFRHLVEVVDIIASATTESNTLWSRSFPGELYDVENDVAQTVTDEDIGKSATYMVSRIAYNFQCHDPDDVREAYAANSLDWSQPARQRRLDSFVRIAALINCDIGTSAYAWSLNHLTPVFVRETGGKSYLGLVPSIALTMRNLVFYLAKDTQENRGKAALVARIPGEEQTYILCLFPPEPNVFTRCQE